MSLKKLIGTTATMSWIDKKAQIPVDDPDPGSRKRRAELMVGGTFRFTNLLEAFVAVDAQGRISGSGFTTDSGIYRGPSKFGINSKLVGKIGRSHKAERDRAIFRQLVGARTVSHEVAGGAGGGGAGILGGGAGGFWLGGPVGAFIGAVTLGTVGYFSGKEVAELVMSFPPIWTELELTIHVSGKAESRLVSHSVFPSHTFYACELSTEQTIQSAVLTRVSVHDGDQSNLKRWQDKGWGPPPAAGLKPSDGNPWGMENPAGTIGEKLSHEVPIGY